MKTKEMLQAYIKLREADLVYTKYKLDRLAATEKLLQKKKLKLEDTSVTSIVPERLEKLEEILQAEGISWSCALLSYVTDASLKKGEIVMKLKGWVDISPSGDVIATFCKYNPKMYYYRRQSLKRETVLRVSVRKKVTITNNILKTLIS
jgi:hypothetical protein